MTAHNRGGGKNDGDNHPGSARTERHSPIDPSGSVAPENEAARE
jgi:hypothetical protein